MSIKSDSDVHISRENQKKINKFAIRNGWIDELNEEVAVKQKLIQNLEDAETEIALLDEKESVRIFIGETFVSFSQEKGAAMIVEMMAEKKNEISKLKEKEAAIKKEMEILKKELYAQFGESINLESED